MHRRHLNPAMTMLLKPLMSALRSPTINTFNLQVSYLRGYYRVPGIEPKSAAYKASTRSTVLLLQPLSTFSPPIQYKLTQMLTQSFHFIPPNLPLLKGILMGFVLVLLVFQYGSPEIFVFSYNRPVAPVFPSY